MDVSVIVPVYQVELYIDECLRSVMRQAYDGEMECLVIDDCGTDSSMAIVERLIKAYNGPVRFTVIHHERNSGLSASRNTGIQHASGNYLFFLDSDDTIAVNCIAILMGMVKADSAIELVQGNTETYPKMNSDPRTKDFSLLRARNNDEVRSSLFETDQFSAFSWNKLVKKSFVLEHKLWFKEGVLYEDNLWQFHLLKHLKNVCFVRDITYTYRVRPNSIMTGTDKFIKAENLGIVYHEILSDLTKGYEKEEYEYYAKGLSKIYFRYAHLNSILKDDFRLCWKKRSFGSIKVRSWLAISYLLEVLCFGKFVTALKEH